MSKLTILYNFHETIIDDENVPVAYFTKDLPHKDFILNKICNQFNKDADNFLWNLINEDFENKILILKAHPYRGGHRAETNMAIDVIVNNGVRLTKPFREKLYDWVGAQLIDGWGEGIFGFVNIMTASDGTRFIVE